MPLQTHEFWPTYQETGPCNSIFLPYNIRKDKIDTHGASLKLGSHAMTDTPNNPLLRKPIMYNLTELERCSHKPLKFPNIVRRYLCSVINVMRDLWRGENDRHKEKAHTLWIIKIITSKNNFYSTINFYCTTITKIVIREFESSAVGAPVNLNYKLLQTL